jgi:AraC-like DNA-binding protein
VNDHTNLTHAHESSYRRILQRIPREIPCQEVLAITTLPRGGLQIAQPANLSDALVKTYTKDTHKEDRLSWRAILQNKPVRLSAVYDPAELHSSRLYQELLQPNGFTHVAAAPLVSPVLEGYAGAVWVCRTGAQPDFTDAELATLASIAERIDQASEETRAGASTQQEFAWAHRPKYRQFIFDHEMRAQMRPANQSREALDERLWQEIVQHGRQRLHHVNGEVLVSDRVQLPDSRGDLWTFRVVTHKTYPALGHGAFVFFCLQPACYDWTAVEPADFQADRELSRLIPSLRFMQQEFHRGPTLGEIARTAHLSPFHFHRRFTELLGTTPKHFMLECQIFEAKRQLVAREKDLVQIAKDCGFAHQSHFTSRFKQATGLTPTRWRRLASERHCPGSN